MHRAAKIEESAKEGLADRDAARTRWRRSGGVGARAARVRGADGVQKPTTAGLHAVGDAAGGADEPSICSGDASTGRWAAGTAAAAAAAAADTGAAEVDARHAAAHAVAEHAAGAESVLSGDRHRHARSPASFFVNFFRFKKLALVNRARNLPSNAQN